MMPKVSNEETENCLRELLKIEGYELSPIRASGETGVDILATKNDTKIHIEVIGYKSKGPARAKDFFQTFFQAVSRLDDGAVRCVIAMPHYAKTGLPSRANQYRVAWPRIGKAFPELEIWLVNVDGNSYEKFQWTDWNPA